MATLGKPRIMRAEEAIESAGGDARDLFRTAETPEAVEEAVRAVPSQYHNLIWSVARHYANISHRAMAAAAGALVAQQLYEPNSSYGMWASTNAVTGAALTRGANATPGAVYNFASYIGGNLGPQNGVVNFTRGQRFFGLMTGPMDSNAGWTFVGQTVKIASDAISGIETDTSFALFRPEIVQSRMIKGEYESFEITVETVIAFTAQAYLPVGITAAPSIEGLSVAFWDARCLNKELTWLKPETMDYDGMVRELVERIDGGRISRKMLLDYVPERNRGRR